MRTLRWCFLSRAEQRFGHPQLHRELQCRSDYSLTGGPAPVSQSGAALMTCSMVTKAWGNTSRRDRVESLGPDGELSHTDDFIFAAFAFIPSPLSLLAGSLCLLSSSASVFDGAKNGTWEFFILLFFIFLHFARGSLLERSFPGERLSNRDGPPLSFLEVIQN